MIAAYNDISNIDFKQDCVHIRKYISKRMAKNFDMRAIVKMERPDVAPAVYAQIQCCQPTSAAVEQSFSMLGKLLSKIVAWRHELHRVVVLLWCILYYCFLVL